MKKTVKWLALCVSSVLLLSFLAFPASAATKGARVWDDWESYSDSSDILYYIGVQKRNKAVVATSLDTNSVLGGKNCVKVDFDLHNNPGYATFWHEPDQDTRGLENLTTVTDGFKINMAANCNIYVRLRLSFSWTDYQNDIFVKVGPTPKTYTVRWEDGWDADMLKQMATCDEFCRLEMVIFDQENEGLKLNNDQSGSLYFDDFCFFKGSDKTDSMDDVGYLGVDMGKPALKTTGNAGTTTTTTTNKPTATASNTAAATSTTTSGDNSTESTEPTDQPDNSDSEPTDSEVNSDTKTSDPSENSDEDQEAQTEPKGIPVWIWIVGGCVIVAGLAVAIYFILKSKRHA